MRNKKCITLLMFLLLIGIATITLPLIGTTTWSDDIMLTTDIESDAGPAIIETSDGRIWIVWQRLMGFSYDLFYMTSSDDGVSWSNKTRLTTDPNHHDTAASIFQLMNGTIWIVWASDRAGNYDLFHKASSDYGLSWSSERQLTTDPSKDLAPSIIQAKDGTLWIVWERAFIDNWDLFYMTSSDGGVSWSNETRLTTDSDHDKLPSIIQMWDGRIWVFWCSCRMEEYEYEIFYKIYDGVSWSDDVRLTVNPDIDMDPTVVQARDGSIWVFWSSREPRDNPSSADDLFYKFSSDNGATWSDTFQLTTDSNDDMWPSTTQVSDKKIWVAWTSNRNDTNKNDDFDIYYKTSSVIVIHDVAIGNITPSSSSVYRGENVSINVLAQNEGEEQGAFDVSVTVNSTFIGSKEVVLSANTSTVLTFFWNTSGLERGDYIISASATPVVGETVPNLDDNSLSGSVVRVKIPGDVNDDGIVNIIDLAIIGQAYGACNGEPRYNQDADINHDDVINIDDVSIAGINYGKTK